MYKHVSNIDCFNAAVAVVLTKLYAEFPKPCRINSKELLQDQRIPENCQWQENLTPNVSQNVIDYTIDFLQTEGFMRAQKVGNTGQYHGCILTSKGFTVLQSTPASIETRQEPLGERITKATPEFIGSLVKSVIQAGLGHLFG